MTSIVVNESDAHFLYKVRHTASANNRDRYGEYNWTVAEEHPLQHLLQKLPQRFSFEGRTYAFCEIPLQLKLAEGADPVACGTISKPHIPKLLDAAKVSPFGKGSQTVIDETVRKGKELSSVQLTLGDAQSKHSVGWGYSNEQTIVTKMTDVIKKHILSQLPPDFLSSEARVEFYKLAIYEPGGHFQTHRDTVHSADHKATLLIEVKSEHDGGELFLEKNGHTVNWDIAATEADDDPEKDYNGIITLEADENEFVISDDETPPDQQSETPNSGGSLTGTKRSHVDPGSKWCIFYTDVEHRVEPVTSGIRMVLQFDVYDTSLAGDQLVAAENSKQDDDNYADDGSWDVFYKPRFSLSGAMLPPSESALVEIIEWLKGNLTSSSEALAIPLYYLYTSQSIRPEMLKNLDRVLFDELMKAGFAVAVSPVELTAESNYEGAWHGRDAMKYLAVYDFPLLFHRTEVGSLESGFRVKPMKAWPKHMKLTYVISGMEATSLLSQKVYVEYTGNEAALGENHYLCGAMIILRTSSVKSEAH